MSGRRGRSRTSRRSPECRDSRVRGSLNGWAIAVAAVGLLAWTGEAAAQTAPKVISVSVDESPSNGDTYGLGERIDVLVYFDQAVRVDGGTPPQVALQIGGETRYASYWYYGPYVHFAYIVTAEDKDTDGISIPANALTSNGPSILLASDTSVAADLSHEAVAAGPNHRVDGGIVSVPIVQTVFFQSSSQRGDVYGRDGHGDGKVEAVPQRSGQHLRRGRYGCLLVWPTPTSLFIMTTTIVTSQRIVGMAW